jgi:signal transduction histidine kinase
MAFTNSIRGQFQLWLAFLLVCILSGFGASVYRLQRVTQLTQIDDELQRRAAAVAGAIHEPPGPPFGFGWPQGRNDIGGSNFNQHFENPEGRRTGPGSPWPVFGEGTDPWHREIRLAPEVARLFDETDTNSFYFAVWSHDGELLKGSTNAPAGIHIPQRSAEAPSRMRTRDRYREAIQFVDFGECVVVGRSIGSDLAALRQFEWMVVVVGCVVLAVGWGGGWWLATRAIKPIADISATAERIAEGDLSQRIVLPDRGNELGRLAGVLNSTFARLDASFQRQRQFTADAAHELRTPVSVVLTHAQNGLAAGCDNEEHREALEACQRAARRMRRLTETLLELARFDSGQPMVRVPCDLSHLALECVQALCPLANQAGVRISCELTPVECKGEPEFLAQVITNLACNAIQYNRPNGEVIIQTFSESGEAVLTVRDTGIGIAPDSMPHIFERFYRADAARAGGQGHAGLGLAISKAIIEAHGGVIEAVSQLGSGSTFTVRLPKTGQRR